MKQEQRQGALRAQPAHKQGTFRTHLYSRRTRSSPERPHKGNPRPYTPVPLTRVVRKKKETRHTAPTFSGSSRSRRWFCGRGSCPTPEGAYPSPTSPVIGSTPRPDWYSNKRAALESPRAFPLTRRTSLISPSFVYSVWRASAFARRPLAVEPGVWK